MKKVIIIILGITMTLFLIIAMAGIIKFRILGDDIYVEQMDGSVIKANDIISDKTHSFICRKNRTIEIKILKLKHSPSLAFLNLDGKAFKLNQLKSTSDLKYHSENKDLVFVERDNHNQAFIEKNGKRIYDGCIPTKKNTTFSIKLPESNLIIDIEGKPSDGPLKKHYSDDLEKGQLLLFSQNITKVSKGMNKEKKSYFVIPYNINNQGSGVFWYMGLFQQNHSEPYTYKTVDSHFLGDRIAEVQLTNKNELVNISFKDYAVGQPFTEKPKMEKKITLQVTQKGFILLKKKNL